jgi:hypothetical protein
MIASYLLIHAPVVETDRANPIFCRRLFPLATTGKQKCIEHRISKT